MRNAAIRATAAALLAATVLASASTAGAMVSPNGRGFGVHASAKPDPRAYGHGPTSIGHFCRRCGGQSIGRFGRSDLPAAVGRWSLTAGTARF